MVDRPALAAKASKWLREAGQFLILTARKAAADSIAVESAALAFSTVLALVPLLASFLFIGEKVFTEYRPKIINILREVLPYSEETLLGYIQDFLIQAETIRGPGLVGFVVVALIAFSSVEETLNRIWNVDTGRSFRMRAGSLLMLLLWGPLLIGAAFSILALLRTRPAFEAVFQQSIILQSVPFLTTLVGLTMLYWLVPHAPVRFRAAFAGGMTAALLLEGLRHGFGAYLKAASGMSIVYGGFALALIFMTSIHLFWLIALIGSEIAYVEQHFRALRRRGWVLQPPEGRWLALGAASLMAERAKAGRPMTPLALLASRLEVPSPELRRAIRPLLAAGVFKERKGRRGGLFLGEPAENLQVRKVLGVYEDRRRDVLPNLPEGAAVRFEHLREHLAQSASGELGACTLADLVAPTPPDAPDVEAFPCADSPAAAAAEAAAEPATESNAATAAEKTAEPAPDLNATMATAASVEPAQDLNETMSAAASVEPAPSPTARSGS